MSRWTPEMWVLLITGSLSAIGTLITTIFHAWASARGRQENRQQNQRIEKDVAELKGALTGNGDGEEEPC